MGIPEMDRRHSVWVYEAVRGIRQGHVAASSWQLAVGIWYQWRDSTRVRKR